MVNKEDEAIKVETKEKKENTQKNEKKIQMNQMIELTSKMGKINEFTTRIIFSK